MINQKIEKDEIDDVLVFNTLDRCFKFFGIKCARAHFYDKLHCNKEKRFNLTEILYNNKEVKRPNLPDYFENLIN